LCYCYNKEYKEFYLPKDKPGIVTIPAMNFIAVRGKGDPNGDKGEYMEAMQVLYGIAYTIKMSKMGATASKDTSTMSFLRLMDSGGRRLRGKPSQDSIMATRPQCAG